MPKPARVLIHPSQFPEQVRRDLLESLRTRRVNHKFHYDSLKQTQKWLALHQAYSPSRTDADCAAAYDRSFLAAARRISSDSLHLVGLGCGGGQKDTRLLGLLKREGRRAAYTPSDVSVAMVLVAREAALAEIADEECHPLVCDLATTNDLQIILEEQTAKKAVRVVTFFGMIPNFEPQVILPRLAGLLRKGDYLLFSANLAPGPDYEAGVRKILPLYDNMLTRDWLMTFLLDLGMNAGDGELRFAIEEDASGSGLKRVTANFHFSRACSIFAEEERFDFRAGETMRLFFSCRHTPERVGEMLQKNEILMLEEWIATSGEEGVFLCRKSGQ